MTAAPWLATPHAFAGIGSRDCAPDILALMHRIAGALVRLGWAMRSGGAPGADSAFEAGALAAGGRVGLYLPWRGFEGRTEHVVLHEATPRAIEMAPQFHPAWSSMRRGARSLHARNVHQVLGSTCDNPASFVVCWTPDGDVTADDCGTKRGGTLSAIRCADAYGVPTYNLRRDNHRAMWTAMVDSA